MEKCALPIAPTQKQCSVLFNPSLHPGLRNLRDHMNDIELILTMLAEATTTKLTRDRDSKGFTPLKKDARDGGAVAGRTRKDIEKRSGKKVVSNENFKGLISTGKRRIKK